MAEVERALKDKCWAQKQKHDEKFQGAFEGYRNSTEKFKTKVLQELASNGASVIPIIELEKKAKTVFAIAPIAETVIPSFNASALLAHEKNPILKKRIVGKEDIDIAGIIKKLGNSDWVKEGRSFYEANDKICPFCQQETPDSFEKSLSEYFDEAYVTDSKAIDDLVTGYSSESDRLMLQISSITTNPPKFLDVDKLKAENQLLESKITINKQTIAGKKKESSRVVELESLANVVSEISTLIESTNQQIAEHNKMVANLSQERTKLAAQVWRFVLEELKIDLDSYSSSRRALDKAITAMTDQIKVATELKARKVTELRELERQTTSIQPTIDGINSLLSSFGFRGFSLAKAGNGKSYKLVRADGSDAKATLSEGEKTFVTFLYFYHLLKGSDSESGMTTNRVVVFDDPVSSLDSDILFIVGSLIKGLFDEVRTGTGHIKQIFVLTHNVYFHKEVSFNPDRKNVAMTEETFWVVRKQDLASRLVKHDSNPIKTSYELLWTDIKSSDRSNLTIQNTMRRILEHYFRILGGVNPDKIYAMFVGKEKLICKSLFSWVNDGSHSAHDDLYANVDDSVETYLAVFKAIFDKSGHAAHYTMMMREHANGTSPSGSAVVTS